MKTEFSNHTNLVEELLEGTSAERLIESLEDMLTVFLCSKLSNDYEKRTLLVGVKLDLVHFLRVNSEDGSVAAFKYIRTYKEMLHIFDGFKEMYRIYVELSCHEMQVLPDTIDCGTRFTLFLSKVLLCEKQAA